MDGKRKFIIAFSVMWMFVAAGLFAAVMFKWMDRESFKVAFSAGFVAFSVVVVVLTLSGKKTDE